MPVIEFKTDVEVKVEVWCDNCGTGLCRSTQVKGESLYVEACPKCVEMASDEGYEAGRKDGYLDGYDRGFADGGKE